MNRHSFLSLCGGLAGAAGVALSAAATHSGGGNVGIAANMLLVHAAALLAIGLAGRGVWIGRAAFVLLAGLVLFCGDLLMRDYAGSRLFPMSAPIGGSLMIVGWLAVAATAALDRRG